MKKKMNQIRTNKITADKSNNNLQITINSNKNKSHKFYAINCTILVEKEEGTQKVRRDSNPDMNSLPLPCQEPPSLTFSPSSSQLLLASSPTLVAQGKQQSLQFDSVSL